MLEKKENKGCKCWGAQPLGPSVSTKANPLLLKTANPCAVRAVIVSKYGPSTVCLRTVSQKHKEVLCVKSRSRSKTVSRSVNDDHRRTARATLASEKCQTGERDEPYGRPRQPQALRPRRPRGAQAQTSTDVHRTRAASLRGAWVPGTRAPTCPP